MIAHSCSGDKDQLGALRCIRDSRLFLVSEPIIYHLMDYIFSIVHCAGGCVNDSDLIAFAILSEVKGGLRS